MRFFRSTRGSHVAEFSVILPFLIFITVGGLVLSLTVWSKIVVTDAAREGARYEALNMGSAQTKVDEVLADGNLDVVNLQSVDVVRNANYITVTVKYNQPSIIPLLPELVGGDAWNNTFLIQSSQVFKIEKP